jgi:HisJ family histidinol phosphate phosphatase
LEIDFFPENSRISELYEILDIFNFEFLIGSVHMLDEFSVDYMYTDWKKLSQSEINAYFIKYWQNIKLLAESDYFDCVGHLDIPKIFNAKAGKKKDRLIKQSVDLAKLSQGLLKGEALTEFVNRSYELIK